jgi:hypothetical protein
MASDRRLKRGLEAVVRALVVATIVPVALSGAAWAVLLPAPVLAAFCFCVGASALAVGLRPRPLVRGLATGAVLVVALGLGWRTPLREVNRASARLAALPRAEGALEAFSLRDKLAIYGLNVAMGTAGLVLYPEVASETLLLTLPAGDPQTARRIFHSDFPLRSPRIAAVVRSFEGQLADATSGAGPPVFPRQRVAWAPGSVPAAPGEMESRVRLALDPCEVSATARRSGSDWVLDVAVEARVAYPRQARTCLWREPELCVEEGLFWVLQEAHWLHPYTAVWRFERRVRSAAGQT